LSETDLGRALEFMQQPQDVEVHRGGNWVLGSMIGWRREADSSCRIMVRLTEEGEEKTAWADLQDVRLAERGTCPPTQSLPFLPRLPQESAEHPPSNVATKPGEEQFGPRTSTPPVGFHGPRADAWAGTTALESGRRRAQAGLDESPSEPRWGASSAGRAPSMHQDGQAPDVVASWWPSWEGPADVPEVEPTRLLTLRRPRQR
jgi:hypothetical protein